MPDRHCRSSAKRIQSPFQSYTFSMIMLSVKNCNLLQVMPQIKEEINDSVLVAFDSEMSGITGAKLNASFQTLEQRYANLRRVVHEHSLIQFGVTVFRHDPKNINQYIASTYSFHLFDSLNKAIDQTEPRFTYNYKSFNFLIANNFNIKEWAQDGLHFIRKSKQEKLIENFDRLLEASCSDLKREITNDSLYIIAWLRHVNFEKTLFEDSKRYQYECRSRLKLKYKPLTNYLFNYYFLLNIRKFLLERSSIDAFLEKDEYLWCDNHQDEYFYVYLVKMENSETSDATLEKSSNTYQLLQYIDDVNWFQELMQTERGNLLDKMISISTIITWIAQSKALVVGHNCFLDLLFLYHNFIDQLPETLGEFKEKIHQFFPKIYDTKQIAQQERTLKLRYTSLLDTFVHLCIKRDAYRNCVPDIFLRSFNDLDNPRTDDYMNAIHIKRFQKIEAHNAGFDSFITGFVFLYFGYILMRQAKQVNQRKSERKYLCDYRIFLDNSLKNHCNKLYLARHCNLPLFLALPTNPVPRFFAKSVLNFENAVSVDIFQKFIKDNSRMIDLHQPSVYGRQFYVGASHPAKMELFLYGLVSRLEEQKQKLSIKNYEEHKKYSPLRKISWFTFLSSATCFTLLFTRFLLNRD